MPPSAPKTDAAEPQSLVRVAIHPDSPVDVVDGLLTKGEPREFTKAEADALLQLRVGGRVVCHRVESKTGRRTA